ncbi:MAG TPA: hypothetical protein VFX20_15825 [Steroidobacteraceae bacterium]|nr:hypothetical protein [Steroidobacteraceae bacterium]
MSRAEDTIVVFTARSPEQIVREGGSQAWKLDPVRARQCTWLVCTQNQHHPNHEFSTATQPHRSGFLLGRISEIRRPPEHPESTKRWQVAISKFARIDVAELWDHGRNPVRYTSLAELGINIEGLEWRPVSGEQDPDLAPTQPREPTPNVPEALLTIAEAKKRLAVTFGVRPEAIEIVVRG